MPVAFSRTRMQAKSSGGQNRPSAPATHAELVRVRGGKQDAGLGTGGGGHVAQHVVAAGGVRVDQITVFIPTGLDGAGNLILIGPAAGEHLLDLGEQLVGKGVGTPSASWSMSRETSSTSPSDR